MTVTLGSVEQLLDLYQVEGKTVAILVEGPDGLPRLGGCDMLRVHVWTEGEGYLVARRQVEGAIVHLEISSLRRVAASILKYRRGGLIGSLSRAQVLYCADPGAEVLIQLLHKGVTARPLSNQQKMLRRKRAQSGLYDRVYYDLRYTVSSMKGDTAHVTLLRHPKTHHRLVRSDEPDCGRV